MRRGEVLISENKSKGAGAPSATIGLGQLLNFALQLALILIVAYVYKIEENAGLLRIAPFLFIGFVVHAMLPMRFRMWFFLLLSFYLITIFLGFRLGFLLVLVGLGLMGICHLPIGYWKRLGLLVAAGVLLALIRTHVIETPLDQLPSPLLPLLAIMFMFRIALYVYEMDHFKQPVPMANRLSYFYLLPSTCFPLFPVIDFQTYNRTYYNKPAPEIYQKGLRWMLRGMIHLLLYRFVYHYLTPVPDEVAGLGGAVQFALTSYLLYLRVSGLFHMIVGILCLFGFNLPETHRLYYFASSFTDFWRRINIYWKDFMMTVLYYPLVMKLRHRGMAAAVVIGSLATLCASWLLHPYQTFWLKGEYHLTLQDAIFWNLLGIFVAVNAYIEFKKGRRPSLRKPEWSLKRAAILSAKTVAMFTTMTIMWSFWTSDSIGQWWSIMMGAGESGPLAFLLLALGLIGLFLIGIAIQYVHEHSNVFASLEAYTGRGPALATVGVAVVLIMAGQPALHGRFGSDTEQMVALLASEQLNRRDEERITRGYYEDLLDNQAMAAATWQLGGTKPRDWLEIENSDVIQPTDDLLFYELKPSFEGTHHRVKLVTNQWGMRDDEYEKAKPEGAYRIAMIGASFLMGSGVEQDSDFESLIEDRLNEMNTGDAFDEIEVLNFGVGGRSLPQLAVLAENEVLEFQPDMIMLVEDTGRGGRATGRLARAIHEGVPVQDPALGAIIDQAEVRPNMSEDEIKRQLVPFEEDIVEACYKRIAELCDEHGVTPVWVPMPMPSWDEGRYAEEFGPIGELAEELGFVTVDLRHVYADVSTEEIVVAPWDGHPNAMGHRILAERILEEFREKTLLTKMGIQVSSVETSG